MIGVLVLFGVASMTWGKGGITGNGLRMPLLFGDGMVVMRNEPFCIYGTANALQQVFIEINEQKQRITTGVKNQEPRAIIKINEQKRQTPTKKNGRGERATILQNEQKQRITTEVKDRAPQTTIKINKRIAAEPGGRKQWVRADRNGHWAVEFPPLEVGKTYVLTVRAGQQRQQFREIVAGEVWLCSGQSNMAFPLSQDADGRAMLEQSADSLLRFFHLAPRWETNDVAWSEAVLDSVDRGLYFATEGWQKSSPQTAGRMSAVAYYFGRRLRDSLHVPVALVMNAVGGSTTEAWIDHATLANGFPQLLDDWADRHLLVMDWVTARLRKNTERSTHPQPRHPYAPFYLYETGIEPLEKFPISGVIWYQGESNAHNIEVHERLFPLLVYSWRAHWNRPRLPFLFVQLSSLNRATWPAFRDSQRRLSRKIPFTAMAVSYDVGDSLDVHPRQKRPVGQRLARLALHDVYGCKQMTPAGPMVERAVRDERGVTVFFHWADSLHTSDGCPPRTFELAGEDGVFHPAQACPHGPTIWVDTPEVPRPMWVRYGWQPFTRANLVNKDGLPASTFQISVEL